MLDFIKPNREWEILAKGFEGTYQPSGVFKAAQMKISKGGLTFTIKTGYSNDNCWSARTIIYSTFHYQKDCSVELSKNIWTSIVGKRQGILNVSKGYGELRQSLLANSKLNEFRTKYNSFKLTFKTEGIITEDYEVLPKIELRLKGFKTKKEDFNSVFEIIGELAKELLNRKVIS